LKLDKEHHPQSINQLKEKDDEEIRIEKKSTHKVNINLPVPRSEGLETILTCQIYSYREEFKQLTFGKTIKKKSALNPLRSIFDRKLGIIRATGRIEPSLEKRQNAPPILLPNGQYVVQLLIKETHRKVLRSGECATLAELRDRSWLVKGRQQVKKIVGK